MSNIFMFTMRVRGSKENCRNFLDSFNSVNDTHTHFEEYEKEGIYYMTIHGRWIPSLSLDELCKKYSVDCEIFSSDDMSCSQEHILILNKEVVEYKYSKYSWVFPDMYNTKEDAERVLGRAISDQEWKKGSYISNNMDECNFKF